MEIRTENSTSGRGRRHVRSRGRGCGRGRGSRGSGCGSCGRRQGNQRCHVAIFSALFTQLLDHIVVETNRYATLCLTSTHNGEGPPPTWETDVNEISAYLGFAILM